MSRKEDLLFAQASLNKHLEWINTDYANRPDEDLSTFRSHAEVAAEEAAATEKDLQEIEEQLSSM